MERLRPLPRGPRPRELPHLPPQALLACLRVWGRMYGPVALEVYGQFGPEANPRVLFRAEMDSALEMLGLQKP